MSIICFHNPDGANGYLSNWYLSRFEHQGIEFSSMEQYMMYQKALCFKDEATAVKILSFDDAAKIKELGRSVSGYNETIWNGVRQITIYEGLLSKFKSNAELLSKLKATEDAILAECSVQDRIWGIGLSMNDPERLSIERWKGENLLGFALMKVRDSL